MEAMVRKIADKLRASRRVLFVTGAGISADSGLPTYRGVGGLYDGVETEDGLSIEEALSGECFRERPELTWKYLSQIQHNCHAVAPNAAHRAIVALEAQHEVVVLTQNIDGLHIKAGSSDVIEIHGTLEARSCTQCGAAQSPDEDNGLVPRCAACGGVVRPNVVLFGESLPHEATDRLYRELDEGFDMVFVIGTTAVFPYIAEPVVMAIRAGMPTVEINPARTRLSPHVDFYVPRRAAEAMTAICASLASSAS